MLYIVIPSYNSKSFIDECLNSVLSQVYTDLIIVFVDDGSTDGSLNIVKNRNDSRIIVLEKENGGPSSARNLALNYIFDSCADINNSFIAFVDADDLIGPQYISSHILLAKEFDADIVCSESVSNLDLISDIPSKILCLSRTEALSQLYTNKIFSFSCIKLFKLELWQGIRFPVECSNSEDVATIFKVFYKSKKIIKCDLKQYYYRDNPNSIIRRRQTNVSLISMQEAYYLRAKETCSSFSDLNNFEDLKNAAIISFCNTVINTSRHLDLRTIDINQRLVLKKIFSFFDEVYDRSYFGFSIKRMLKLFCFRIVKIKVQRIKP